MENEETLSPRHQLANSSAHHSSCSAEASCHMPIRMAKLSIHLYAAICYRRSENKEAARLLFETAGMSCCRTPSPQTLETKEPRTRKLQSSTFASHYPQVQKAPRSRPKHDASSSTVYKHSSPSTDVCKLAAVELLG